MSGYPTGGTGDVATGDTVNQAISKLETKADNNATAITAEASARETADRDLDAKINSAKTNVAENSDFLSVATAATENGVTYTISTSNIASASDLEAVSGKADDNAELIAKMSGTTAVDTGKYITSVTQTSGAVSIGQADLNASAVAFDKTPAAVSAMTATTVQGAVEELKSEIATSELTLWHAGAEVGDHKVLVDGTDYTLKQGNDTVAIFNIAQDMVVSAGTVITATGEEKTGHGAGAPSAGLTSGATYVKLDIANGDECADRGCGKLLVKFALEQCDQ